jgi:glycosyltransferase involved in cell wall biosynthesis
MSGLVGLVAGRCLRLPIVNASIRSAPPALHVRDRVGRWCARHSDAIVANAQAGLHAFGLADHARARVIANGIDLARFDHIVARDDGDASICMVANFNHHKHHATAIRAVPHIRHAVPRARLVLVGHDAGTLAAARRLVDQLGVGDAVQIVTDSVRPEPFIAGSAVCVLSSRDEALSNAVMEYMALGKPVVASACAGNATLVRDGETGFLVPPGSPEALAARVIDVLRDPQRARRMGAEGRRRIEATYSLRRMVAEYEALYDQVLAASGRPR